MVRAGLCRATNRSPRDLHENTRPLHLRGAAAAFAMGVAMFTAIFMGAALLPGAGQAGDRGGRIPRGPLDLFALIPSVIVVTFHGDTPVDAPWDGAALFGLRAGSGAGQRHQLSPDGVQCSLLPPSWRFRFCLPGNGGSILLPRGEGSQLGIRAPRGRGRRA